jgi:hypothetical protein
MEFYPERREVCIQKPEMMLQTFEALDRQSGLFSGFMLVARAPAAKGG